MQKFSFWLRLGLVAGVLSSCFYLLAPALRTLAQSTIYLPTVSTPTATLPALTSSPHEDSAPESFDR
jgi:hypothetical protein